MKAAPARQNSLNQPLAPYACDPLLSRGRLHQEPPCPAGRSEFQRDRDRIIHSTAFRRLEYKTQVFVNHEGDHYRTRLTHSLEVAQLARSLCRSLALNEDLAETIALAHDLGHTPFGHAGEDALKEAMAEFGGFSHNAQTIRVLTKLEDRYAEFDGLNLTWETLEGIAKHNGPVMTSSSPRKRGEVGRGVSQRSHPHPDPPPQAGEENFPDLELHTWPSLEAQVAALADDIAYHNHDIDDGLRAGLFVRRDLMALPLVGDVFKEVEKTYPKLEESRLIHESIRRLINRMVVDLLEQTSKNITASRVKSADEVRHLGRALAAFSSAMEKINRALKAFLMQHMYRHYKVNRMTSKARRIVKELFLFFLAEPECLPTEWQSLADKPGSAKTANVVADYIAGMTDRYAFEEYRKLIEV